MHSPFRKRGVILAGLLALVLAAVTPAIATAKPEPGAKAKGFRLFARSLGAMTINRIYLGLNSDGEVGVDSTNSSTIGGGFWPKGTPDQYIFNSGLQIAGVIGPDGGPWAGDTTGAFFFDPKGTTQHGVEVEPIYNTTDANDYANMPTAGKIPQPPDSEANLFYSLLHTDPTSADGRRTQASQGDVWFMSWDGNPSLNAGRKHPLGVVVETRGMGWNYPTGNEDIAYFIYTFYNVTTQDPNAYVGVRPEMKDILLEQAAQFQAANNAAFGVTLPSAGYTINNMYAAFATDMDVATSGQNWSSVNLPFAMGYTYTDKMAPASGWTFDAATFGPPFFSGVGFAGIKYLKSPNGPGKIQLFSNTINGSPFSGAFNDPQNTIQLWRYLSANISVPAGDQPCNMGLPSTTHICWVNNTQPADMRFFQSSTGLTLPPGGQGTIVVAYIFAAPVAIPGCSSAPCPSIKPGTAPYLLGSTAAPNNGATTIDSLTGYQSCTDSDGSGFCEQTDSLGVDEWKVVPGSLLGKAYTAQAVFDAQFLLPFAPTAPKFFLIPGDNAVTVIWQPSASEVGGDPYYAVASDVNNALYDPNYRQYDVEGYRIYRGRVDNQDQLSLVAQFDFKGTVFNDYDGVVNSVNTCAPNLNVLTDCPVPYQAPWTPGVPRTVAHENPIVSPLVQVLPKDRLELATGLVYDSKTDTLITGRNTGLPPLTDTGVPYVFVDNTVRNNFRYFYVVTAFDVNSLISGPSSLESPKAGTVAIVPQAPASNVVQTGTLTSAMYGRGVNQTAVFPSVPSINSTTGVFSGPFPPANGATLGFVGQFASQVVGGSGALTARLDSFQLGQTDLSGCCGGSDPAGGVPVSYYYTLGNGTDSVKVSAALQQQLDVSTSTQIFFDALKVDATLAAVYGGDGTYVLKGQFQPAITSGPKAGDWGLGLGLGEPGFTSSDFTAQGATGARYNGVRWFDGPSPANNEVTADPIQGSCGSGTGACPAAGTASFPNAGVLTGVTAVYQPLSYTMFNREWRNMAETQSGARRAADYNVYWGAAGKVDSVIDVTHNVVVPFQSTQVNGGWGILNTSAQGAGGFDARPTVLTPTDWTCVEPFRTLAPGKAGDFFQCTSASPFLLSNTATLGSIAFGSGDNQSTTQPKSVKNTANLEPNPGFSMYVAGSISFFEMTALPAAGTVWSLRDYTGIVYGGNGTGGSGNNGPYSFVQALRPFTALGAELHTQYDVVNQVNAATNQGLDQVHTIPDPYYVTNAYENTYDNHIIKFVNLPTQATIRIYSSSGVLVRVLQYSSPEYGGALDWNVKNRNNQVVASGVYFYQIESGNARRIGRMTIVTFAK